MMRVAVWCLQSDFSRRPSMSVVVKVLEGSIEVENNLDYNFTIPVGRRAIRAAGEYSRKKLRLSKDQSAVLEESFKEHKLHRLFKAISKRFRRFRSISIGCSERFRRFRAACALLNLSLINENKISIVACGAIPPLITLLMNGSNRGKKDEMTTLYKLCTVKVNKERAVKALYYCYLELRSSNKRVFLHMHHHLWNLQPKKGGEQGDANKTKEVLESLPDQEEEVIGIITMEDVLEELLQEEILDETDEYVDVHNKYIHVDCFDIHGKQKQQKRTSTFFDFCKAEKGILLCTDVASRCLDIPAVIDGFEQEKKVVVIAATNRKQDLDPALISRFDSMITFGLPDQQTRQEIAAQYAKHLAKSDLAAFAKVTEESIKVMMESGCEELLPANGRKLLNGLVFSLLLPCLIFSQLGQAITLEKMIEWWFIPFNVVLATISGSLIGLLVASIVRPPYPFFKFTIIQIGIGYSAWCMLGSGLGSSWNC
ncbi:Protein PIN-LIKES 6 [Camellia lanceoleosa]|uniref:Protein PIN-LIKES 6 n=1 Tax=Camellia lanceoleosa TaxID=1840588 RepID=A0ACC0H4K3_9ERIC|nr:Protein PIN-LIKES 6 [Camellia lanceoleosa]